MKKTTKKKIIIYSAVILAIAAVVIVTKTVQTKKDQAAQFDVSPSVVTATIDDIGIYIPASGTISSGNEQTVFADTQGTVRATYFKVGDFVNAGDVIVSVDDSTLAGLISDAKDNVYSQRSTIDNYDNETQNYTIKAPVKGRVKDINVKHATSSASESSRERAEDIEAEYGYLVSIAVGDSMYITVTENTDQYEVGQEVDAIIHQESDDKRIYRGAYVEKIENGTVYIYVDSNFYDDNTKATVYTADGKTELGEGITEYKGIQYVVGAKGYIEITSTYTNQSVNEGDILYYSYSNISQTLLDMYAQLEELEEELADLEAQYANLNIAAPVSGFLQNLNVSEGDSINTESVVCAVADTSIWAATVQVDELDISSIETGMTATVTIDALPDEQFEGTVKRISSVGINSNGVTTYTVEIELQSDERFKLSMNVSSEILAEKVENVVSVPIQAVRYMDDKAYVVVYVERTEEEIEQIKQQILQEQKMVAGIEQMSEEELEQFVQEKRGQKDDATKDNTDFNERDGLTAGGLTKTPLSIADRLYGRIVFVETGIQDETKIEIKSGLKAGAVVLLSTENASVSAADKNESGFAMGKGFR